MRWIVGLDLRARSQGALGFARWLYQHARHHRFFAVHALALPQPYGGFIPDQLGAQALVQLNRALEEADAASAIADVGVVTDELAERGLERAIEEHSADGVIIGRRAPAGAARLVALGRVARRMIRRVAQPTIVVPPELELARLERGPIVVASDLGASSSPALRFASKLAEELGRELVIAHVVRVHGSLEGIVSQSAWSSAQLEHCAQARARLEVWAREGGAASARLHVAVGPSSPELLAFAEGERASLIVCGSRRLSLAERVFTSSVGTELAAAAQVPVAIIPYDHEGDEGAEGIQAFT